MANERKMDLQVTMRNLFSRGWTLRRIVREFHLHLNTVRPLWLASRGGHLPRHPPVFRPAGRGSTGNVCHFDRRENASGTSHLL